MRAKIEQHYWWELWYMCLLVGDSLLPIRVGSESRLLNRMWAL